MAQRDVVVIGASSGGLEALIALAGQFPADFPAGVLAVLHIAPEGSGRLAEVVGRTARIKVALAQHGQVIPPGHMLLAPPDQHMLVDVSRIRLIRGPRENRTRPAVDPLFRSAAVAFGPRVIGIVLTGCLDDGSAGLVAIKRCGGLAVIQDPEEAAYPDMPRSASQAVQADHILSIARMGPLLKELTSEQVDEHFVVPPDLAREAAMSKIEVNGEPSGAEELNAWGNLVPVSCPECGGPIWEHRDGELRRYRCLVGHSYTAKALLAEQCEKVENALWMAIRTLEERARMLAKLAEDEQRSGKLWMTFAERAAEVREQAQILRSLLVPPQKTGKPQAVKS